MEGMEIKTISFAGAGNVACNLAPALLKAGFAISGIIGRNQEHAANLARSVNARHLASVAELDNETDLLILALPDQAIPVFAQSLKNAGIYNGLVAHTSGSQSLGALQQYIADSGVFYPLQSFTRYTHPDIAHVPFCIEGATPEISRQLSAVASALSADIRMMDTAQRASIHLAAVFASNFSNFMYSVADCLLGKAGIETDILLPLIRETALRIKGNDAALLQTGPAVRRDWSTIDMHLNMLRNNPDLKEIYKIISDNIIKRNNAGGVC